MKIKTQTTEKFMEKSKLQLDVFVCGYIPQISQFLSRKGRTSRKVTEGGGGGQAVRYLD